MQLYVFNLTVKLFLSLNGKTSQQKEKNNVPLALIAIYTQTHSKIACEQAFGRAKQAFGRAGN